MKSSRQVLLEVVLFQSRGRGHPQSDATPNFFPEYKCSILRLSNKVSFVFRFSCKGGKNLEKEKSILWLNVSNCLRLYLVIHLRNSFNLLRSCPRNLHFARLLSSCLVFHMCSSSSLDVLNNFYLSYDFTSKHF